ncbi:TetR/AcrR family transcriptional regulator [Nocardia sp. NPDC059239]|uniref:TetR/AcrR family transcriptional regulator n=1 Tax=unclassified Nocardia TaxID=2637762 RepID=UPI0036AF49E0
MAKRMTPEARRLEILAVARQTIAEQGIRALSIRELARRCGMSAPGLMHYFPDMQALLVAVLDERDRTDSAAVSDQAGGKGLLGLLDAGVDYYSSRAQESNNFDALEAEAQDPFHPAHAYFADRFDRMVETVRPYVADESSDPDDLFRVVRLILEGSRAQALRGMSLEERLADWHAVRRVLLAHLGDTASRSSQVHGEQP